MKLSQVGELSLLEKVRSGFTKKSKAVVTGIGDDAAVLRPRGKNLLVTTDMMLEGVHFDLRLITPFQLGFKIISVNVSDIYAMAGRPCFALLGIAAAKSTKEAFLDMFFEGVRAALEFYKITLIGGDISSAEKEMVLSATLIGHAERPVRRSGAKPGDRIYVTGSLGQAACGLELSRIINKPVDMKKPVNKPLKWDIMRPLLGRHLMPEARRPAPFASCATAMIDLSDGLFIDLVRLCTESNVGARLYKDGIPVSDETKAAALFLGLDPLKVATSGGEDYELLFTAPLQSGYTRRFRKAVCIGEITESKMLIVDKNGRQRPITPEGYQHFRQSDRKPKASKPGNCF